MHVLGIETSCDETSVAIYSADRGLLAHEIYSQAKSHAAYGGVVPELASRDHVRKLLPMIDAALSEADLERPDAIAYTAGPGLIGALLVGGAVARGLALGWDIPALPVHHMEAHLLAPLLEDEAPQFPFVALLVSGGHSMLVDVQDLGRYEVLGETRDDAAGEAFDKVAKLLGLGYPGGPAIARAAEQGRAGTYEFPRPMMNRPGFEFSFSGLKTAVLVQVRELEKAGDLDDQQVADIARAFEDAVVDTLCGKSLRALEETGRQRLVVAGGVGANRKLRETLKDAVSRSGARVYYPRPAFCTDNAAMVAYAGSLRLEAGERAPDSGVGARARWPLESLVPAVAG